MKFVATGPSRVIWPRFDTVVGSINCQQRAVYLHKTESVLMIRRASTVNYVFFTPVKLISGIKLVKIFVRIFQIIRKIIK
jgi:hypothetical protein